MTSNWLQAYLVTSIRKELCTRIYCTPCGAMEFREGAVDACATALGLLRADGLGAECALAITEALASVRPLNPREHKWLSATRCLLFDVCRVVGEPTVEGVLGSSWSGEVLREMQNHTRKLQEKRRALAEFDSPEAIRRRREEKSRLRRERHEQRLAGKALRDAEWRNRRPGGGKQG